jgi:hypothetical protein
MLTNPLVLVKHPDKGDLFVRLITPKILLGTALSVAFHNVYYHPADTKVELESNASLWESPVPEGAAQLEIPELLVDYTIALPDLRDFT